MGAVLKSKSGRTILRNLKTRMIRLRESVDGIEVVAGFVRGKSSLESIFKAYVNEFGTHGKGIFGLGGTDIKSSDKEHNIPSRPFMEQSLPEIKSNIPAVFADATTRNIKDRMKTAGEVMEVAIEASLSSGNFVENSDYTIAKKGSSQPLVDTGDMRNNITSQVRRAR